MGPAVVLSELSVREPFEFPESNVIDAANTANALTAGVQTSRRSVDLRRFHNLVSELASGDRSEDTVTDRRYK